MTILSFQCGRERTLLIIQHPFFYGTVRILLAVLGGYFFAYCFAAAIAQVIPLAKTDAVVVSALLSFAVYLAFIIFAFSAQYLRHVFLGCLLSLPLAVVGFWPYVAERFS